MSTSVINELATSAIQLFKNTKLTRAAKLDLGQKINLSYQEYKYVGSYNIERLCWNVIQNDSRPMESCMRISLAEKDRVAFLRAKKELSPSERKELTQLQQKMKENSQPNKTTIVQGIHAQLATKILRTLNGKQGYLLHDAMTQIITDQYKKVMGEAKEDIEETIKEMYPTTWRSSQEYSRKPFEKKKNDYPKVDSRPDHLRKVVTSVKNYQNPSLSEEKKTFVKKDIIVEAPKTKVEVKLQNGSKWAVATNVMKSLSSTTEQDFKPIVQASEEKEEEDQTKEEKEYVCEIPEEEDQYSEEVEENPFKKFLEEEMRQLTSYERTTFLLRPKISLEKKKPLSDRMIRKYESFFPKREPVHDDDPTFFPGIPAGTYTRF